MINDYEATKPMTTDAIPAYPPMTSNDEVISTLNGLIQTCKDGEEGFRDAAQNVKASDLKTTFYESSQERSRFVGELQALVRSLGGDPADSGTLMGAVHRGWMDLKTAISANDERGILSECERGEDSAKKAYQDAMAKPLPETVLDVLRTQVRSIFTSHDRIKSLRDAASSEASKTASTNF
ncbi:MAG TPA: PA2169 family four-helix-bundle protein [Pyrinomonadaceae bacterium]|nr:PA2169 family four-helix-bundle protein [Pyrinomonadaceae bacterium]